MRKINLLIFILICLTFGCGQQPAPTNPPENEIRQAIYNFLAKESAEAPTKITVKGLSFQAEKPDVFLVFADVEDNGKPFNHKFIAQKYVSDGKFYWQVIPATPGNLQALGIISPDAKQN